MNLDQACSVCASTVILNYVHLRETTKPKLSLILTKQNDACNIKIRNVLSHFMTSDKNLSGLLTAELRCCSLQWYTHRAVWRIGINMCLIFTEIARDIQIKAAKDAHL